jgi:DNA-binding SARP family transcriptional activator
VQDDHKTSQRSHFDVLLLGPFTLFRDGMPVETTAWQRKVHSLLRILATSPERRRTKDELLELLWPETSSESGYRNLRVVLHMLRRGLAGDPPAVLSESGCIGLNPAHDWDIDLERFQELASLPSPDTETLERALGFYRGEPLGDDRYEDWAIAVRDRTHRLWRDVCLRLGRKHREAATPESALVWLDRLLASDPLDEEALREMMQTLGLLDRRTEALRRYQHFAHRLKQELDLAPGQETQAIVASLKDAAAPASPEKSEPHASVESARPVPVIPRFEAPADGRLYGREGELGRILWTLPPLHALAPRMVMVEGAEGIGKTRLLGEVATRARRANLLTLAGSAYEHEGLIRYGPIRDALADYVEAQPDNVLRDQLGPFMGDLIRMLPELRFRFPQTRADEILPGEDHRLRLFLAVSRALDRIARDAPFVLLLDDLQWADEETLYMLHFLVRQSSHNLMLIVGSYRSGGAHETPAISALSRDLEEAGWSTYVRLGPLEANELGQMLEERVRGRCGEGLVADLHAHSSGNPLQALRLLEHWRREGRVERREGSWDLMDSLSITPATIAQGKDKGKGG